MYKNSDMQQRIAKLNSENFFSNPKPTKIFSEVSIKMNEEFDRNPVDPIISSYNDDWNALANQIVGNETNY